MTLAVYLYEGQDMGDSARRLADEEEAYAIGTEAYIILAGETNLGEDDPNETSDSAALTKCEYKTKSNCWEMQLQLHDPTLGNEYTIITQPDFSPDEVL